MFISGSVCSEVKRFALENILQDKRFCTKNLFSLYFQVFGRNLTNILKRWLSHLSGNLVKCFCKIIFASKQIEPSFELFQIKLWNQFSATTSRFVFLIPTRILVILFAKPRCNLFRSVLDCFQPLTYCICIPVCIQRMASTRYW